MIGRVYVQAVSNGGCVAEIQDNITLSLVEVE